MNIWQRLQRWEKKAEKGPKSQLIKTISLFFVMSVVFGGILSQLLISLKQSQAAQIVAEMRQKEAEKMNITIEELRKVRYAQTGG